MSLAAEQARCASGEPRMMSGSRSVHARHAVSSQIFLHFPFSLLDQGGNEAMQRIKGPRFGSREKGLAGKGPRFGPAWPCSQFASFVGFKPAKRPWFWA